MSLRAGIDIGSNTILLLVAEVENGRVSRVLEDHVRVVRLGQGVDKNHAFHPEAIERALACFTDYAEVLKKYPSIDVRAVATSASRDARNSVEFFSDVKAKTGIAVQVISGQEEAQMSFRGALPDGVEDPYALAVLDIGGGSTEIVGLKARGSPELERHSFDMGCVRLTERFLLTDPPAPADLVKLREFVRGELGEQAELVEALRGRELIGVAGTATYLAAGALRLTRFEPERVQGARVTLAQVRELTERFAKLTAAQRLGIGGMDKGRADVIVAGAVILEETLLAVGLDAYAASVRGLRYGAVL